MKNRNSNPANNFDSVVLRVQTDLKMIIKTIVRLALVLLPDISVLDLETQELERNRLTLVQVHAADDGISDHESCRLDPMIMENIVGRWNEVEETVAANILASLSRDKTSGNQMARMTAHDFIQRLASPHFLECFTVLGIRHIANYEAEQAAAKT